MFAVVQKKSYLYYVWDTPHTMLSIVLRKGYLQVLTISCHNGNLQPNEESDSFFFHTFAATVPALFHTMSAMLAEKVSFPATTLLFKLYPHEKLPQRLLIQ